MKPFQRLSQGDDDRTITLQITGSDAAELLDFLKYVGDHFTECADDHLRRGEHAVRGEYIDLAAIAAKHWMDQYLFSAPSGMKWPPLPAR